MSRTLDLNRASALSDFLDRLGLLQSRMEGASVGVEGGGMRVNGRSSLLRWSRRVGGEG